MRKALLYVFIFCTQQLYAQNFTPGNIVVYRVGTGSAGLSGVANAVFLDEYSPSGILVQSVPLPTATSGANAPLTASGTATSEGLLNRSTDGYYLIATGYGAVPGTAGVASTTSAAVPRVVAVVDYQKNINTSTALNAFSSGNNIRSATSSDGSSIWVTGAANGVAYTTTGSTGITQLSTGVTNLRSVSIAAGQLFVSSSSGTTRLAKVGNGLPVTSGQTITNIPGFPTTGSPYQFQFFDLDAGVAGPDVLYLADDATAGGGIQKYSLVSNNWVANGTMGAGADSYRGLTAVNTGNTVTIYATRKGGAAASGGGELVVLTDNTGYNAAPNGTPLLLASAAANTAFRGVAFAPLQAPAAVNNLSLSFTAVSASSPLQPPAVTTTLSDAGDPLSATGVTVDVKDNGTPILSTDYTLTATTSNTTVVPSGNIVITKADGQATIKITAAAAGYSDITLLLTKGSFTKSLNINVAGSAASASPASTRFHSGTSDASAAVSIDDNFMIVADDEMNKLFVYNRNTSGLPVTSFNFSTLLNLTDLSGGQPREVDVEAAVRSTATANRIYWLGSMSNSATSFNARPNRDRVFAVTSTGTGSTTTFSLVGYGALRQDLINWGDANGYNFTAAALAGKDPKQIDGFNVEGLTFAPNNTTAYIAFRAPLVPTANRTKAVIAPIQNFEAWFNNGTPVGSPTIGSPIELDLGGRGFRDIVRLSNGNYVILAGNYDDLPLNPAVFTWNGLANTTPVLVSSFNLAGLNPEGLLEIKSGGNLLTDRLQILSDNGSVVYYNDGVEAKDLAQNNFKKFRSDVLISGTGSVLPINLVSFVAERKNNASLLTWEVALPFLGSQFIVERSVNGVDFIRIATQPAYSNQGVYQFTDAFSASGKTYYRIATVDASGRKLYSAIRSVNSSGLQTVSLYPNPVQDGLVTLSTTVAGYKVVTLFNASGHKVKTFSFTGAVTDINTSGLARGSYYLVVATQQKIVASDILLVQ